MRTMYRILWLSFFLSTVSFAGDTAGHGGDPLAIEFVARGRYVLSKLNLLGPRVRAPLTKREIDMITKAHGQTRIEMTKDELTDELGGVVTALTLDDPKFPDRKYIRLNIAGWTKALRKNLNVNRLVFHEYLRAAGLEAKDQIYEISSLFDDATALLPERYDEISIEGEVLGNKIPRKKFLDDDDSNDDADAEAANAYYMRYLEWMRDLENRVLTQIGASVTLLNIEVSGFTMSKFFVYDGHSGIKSGLQVGTYYKAEPRTRIYVQTLDPMMKVLELPGHPRIKGESSSFRAFPKMSQAEIIAALDAGYTSYVKACDQWIKETKENLDANFVYADCGIPKESRDSDPSFDHGRRTKFVSYGTIYVLGTK